MEINSDELLVNAMRDALREGLKAKLSGYNGPLDTMIKEALDKHGASFKSLLEESIASCVTDPQFRTDVATSVRHQLAKTLVQRFGGEMEKQVNVLKSDPTTRARITLAIEDIVKSKAV